MQLAFLYGPVRYGAEWSLIGPAGSMKALNERERVDELSFNGRLRRPERAR